MAKNTLKPVVKYGHQHYAFDTIGQAADAIKFFSKLKPVDFELNPTTDRYVFVPSKDRNQIEMEQREVYEQLPKLSLPAPKRGTVPCSVCESVSVRPGHPCESCGAVAPV
jgi:hypothetical protein